MNRSHGTYPYLFPSLGTAFTQSNGWLDVSDVPRAVGLGCKLEGVLKPLRAGLGV